MVELQRDRYEGAEVLFLPVDEGKPELLFYGEDIIRDAIEEPGDQKNRKLWSRVKAWYEHSSVELFAGDRFVRRLGYFRKIKVLLTKPIEITVVKARLQQMLRDQSFHHLRWLLIDIALLPLTFFTMFLPGPNVPFFYLAFRIYSHWMSYRSATHTTLNNLEVEVSGMANEVNALLHSDPDTRSILKELRTRYHIRAFQEHHFIPMKAHMKEVWLKLKQHFS